MALPLPAAVGDRADSAGRSSARPKPRRDDAVWARGRGLVRGEPAAPGLRGQLSGDGPGTRGGRAKRNSTARLPRVVVVADAAGSRLRCSDRRGAGARPSRPAGAGAVVRDARRDPWRTRLCFRMVAGWSDLPDALSSTTAGISAVAALLTSHPD